MPQVTIDHAMRIALGHHQAGRLRQAEEIYRQVLAQWPRHVPAMYHLGLIAHQAGRPDIAVDLIRQAIALNPNQADAHYNLGIALQAKGEIDEAIAAYRRAVVMRPGYADAYGNLGTALRSKGQLDEAIAAYRQAIALRCDHADAHCNLGSALQEKGELDGAITAYGQAVALRPNSPEALSNLGDALKKKGNIDQAIAACRQAIALRPDLPEAHGNLGSALHEKGNLDQAIAAYRGAIALRPDMAVVHSNLGNALREKGDFDQAIAACRQAIALQPNLPDAHNNLGIALRDKGRLDEAIAAYRQAIALRPIYVQAHNNLGIALQERGHLDDAIASYEQAIALRPSYAEAHGNLGIGLSEKGQLDLAIAAFRRAIALDPGLAGSHSNLGIALQQQGQIDDAIAAHRQAIALRPGYAEAHGNLGNALKDGGQLDAAIAAYRRAVELRPDYAQAHGNLVYSLRFHAAYDAGAIAEEHRRWNIRHAEPLRHLIHPHANERSPERRLRIGYVSPDFREHCQSLFTMPLLSAHDRRQVEVFCYADLARGDAVTQRLQSHARQWRNIAGQSDDEVASLVRRDGIDILVDLTMHMAGNRLLVFARKPAPVQVCWLAYPGSTGLSAIDYRLSDPYLDPLEAAQGGPLDGSRGGPAGMDETVYSEQTVRLPESFWCYDPLDGREIPVNPLPALETGSVTFGGLNNFCKVNEAALALWAQVLRQVRGSRLLLLAPQGRHRQRTVDRLCQEGIDPRRIEFLRHQPRTKYLETYHRIDVALDTFPCNGHTTSMDALWMGVPVVTLAGKTAVGRGGLSILSNIGMPELAARSEAQYLRIAGEWAGDLPRLAILRSTLRQRLEQSPLMDAPRFARNIEAAYRDMWRAWCQTGMGRR